LGKRVQISHRERELLPYWGYPAIGGHQPESGVKTTEWQLNERKFIIIHTVMDLKPDTQGCMEFTAHI
jgi:hypothetical protein